MAPKHVSPCDSKLIKNLFHATDACSSFFVYMTPLYIKITGLSRVPVPCYTVAGSIDAHEQRGVFGDQDRRQCCTLFTGIYHYKAIPWTHFLRYCPLCMGSPPIISGFPSQLVSYVDLCCIFIVSF